MKKLLPSKQSISPLFLSSDSTLNRLARQSGWSKRASRKISPRSFVTSFLLAASEGEASFREVASNLGLFSDDTVSKQALWERTGPEAVEFFKLVLEQLVAQSVLPQISCKIAGVQRVLLHDSSILALHRALAEVFPASINQNKKLSAGFRLQTVIDLINGEALSLVFHGYRERNDQASSGDILPLLKKGDLVVRDLGYLVGHVLDKIARKDCFFLSRHINQRAVFLQESGDELDLAKYLSIHAARTGDTVECDVTVGAGQHGAQPIRGRVVARRLPERVINERKREAKRNAKKHSKSGYSKKHLKLLEWEIYLTNLSTEQADAETVIGIYRLRWRIENLFKALKSHTWGLKLARHRSNPSHLQVLVLAWLCLVVMAANTGYFSVTGTGRVHGHPGAEPPGSNANKQNRDEGTGEREISTLKSIRRIFKLISYSLFMSAVGTMEVAFERIERQIQYHDRYESRRKRQNLPEKAKQTLGLT